MLGRKFFPRLFQLKFITKKGKFVKERKIKRPRKKIGCKICLKHIIIFNCANALNMTCDHNFFAKFLRTPFLTEHFWTTPSVFLKYKCKNFS